MPVRLIATDLDGTLFGADHRPSPRTVRAVNAAVDAGIRVAAVSGRSHFIGADLAVSTGARLDWFIGSNGGHRLDYRTGRIQERLLFPPTDVERLTAGLVAELDGLGFGWEIEDRVVYDEPFVRISPVSISGHRRAVGVPPEPTEGVGKIFVGHPEVTGVALVEVVRAHVDDGVNVATSGAPFVELTPPGADKGAALARLCDEVGVAAEEVLAFGDNQNDLSMLAWAGRAVAMGNALAAVVAAADEVTATNVDDGVALVIEALLDG